jgi:allantoinase
MSDFVVRGARVVLDDRIENLEVVVEGERIVALERPGAAPAGWRAVDADGLVLMPGVVDAHVHFDDPGREWWEGFDTGSAAAAAGGVTTVVDMPIDSDPPTITVAAMRAKADAARARSRVDVALWAGLVPQSVGDLDAMAAAGAVGFKAFTCPTGWDEFPPVDAASLRAGCAIAAAHSVPVAVHCELAELGRGPDSEIAAVRFAAGIAAATGARMHLVHASAAGAVDEARRWPGVTVETCPHYLALNADDVDAIGARARCSPPIRDEKNREDLRVRLTSGAVDWVASDHSPCPPEARAGEQPWFGIAGVQLTLPVLLDLGLDLVTVARLTTEAARSLRLEHKGGIAPGGDADLVLVDPGAAWEVTERRLLDRHRASPLVGRTLRGEVLRTWVRGECVYDRDTGIRESQRANVLSPAPVDAK